MTFKFTESVVEEAAIQYLQEIGYAYLPGPDIAAGEPAAERSGYGDVILRGRLRATLAHINPGLPRAAGETVDTFVEGVA